MGFGFPFALGSIMVSMCLSSQGHIASVYCWAFFFFFLKMALTSTLTLTFRTLTPDLWPGFVVNIIVCSVRMSNKTEQ